VAVTRHDFLWTFTAAEFAIPSRVGK
jgi:hypothetical protein